MARKEAAVREGFCEMCRTVFRYRRRHSMEQRRYCSRACALAGIREGWRKCVSLPPPAARPE